MGESQRKVVTLAIFFCVPPIVAVACRFWAKIIKKRRPDADDYMIIPALIFALGTETCQLVGGLKGNLGQHVHLDPQGIPVELNQIVVFLKSEYAFEILTQLSILCSKISLLLLYRRIFISRSFITAAWSVGTVVLVWHSAFFLAFIFQCTPIDTVWNPAALAPHCVNRIGLWLAYAISDVLTDCLILSMPVPAVWQLQMPTRQKVAVSGIFLLGAVVLASGIARTVSFFNAAKTPAFDATYYAAPAVYWSSIEASLSVVGACLPTLRPIFTGFSLETLMGKLRSRFSLSSTGEKRSFSQESPLNVMSTSSMNVLATKGAFNSDRYEGLKTTCESGANIDSSTNDTSTAHQSV